MLKDSIHEKAAFLKDAIFAADDGMITTFAIAAGSAGAGFSPKTVVILGFANLLADGLSMATGVYLGVKSERDYERVRGDSHYKLDSPLKDGIVTYVSFVVAGLFPLVPYLFGVDNVFLFSSITVAIVLFLVGAIKGLFTDKTWIRSGFEMLLVGGASALVAYGVGYLVDIYII